ncbi:MAG TPA: tetratricopeptide repeat protein [Pseudonocardia sp.]|nr:tetratricopeptide repeat protein [Pseudonocardia sp.]
MDLPPDDILALADQEIARLAGDPSPEARGRRANTLIAKASTLAPLGRREEELATYDEVIDSYGDDPEPVLRRFVAQAMLNKASELRSLELFDEVIYRYAQDLDLVIIHCVARAFLSSGICLWDAGRRDEAIARFDEVLRFRPARDPNIRAVVAQTVTMKARALYTLGRFEEALPGCDQAIADYADDPDPRLRTEVIQAYSIQASALGELGRRDEQIQSHLQMYKRYHGSEDDVVREKVVLSMTGMIFALSEAGDHNSALKVFSQIRGDYGGDPNPAIASAFKLAESAIRHSAEADRHKREGRSQAASSGPNPESPDPAGRRSERVDTARIDALARAAEAGNDLETLTALWKATFGLERWWFVLRGDLENPRPFVGVFDGQAFVLAFTTGERVRDFAVAEGYAPADDSAFSITMTPDAAVDAAVGWAAQGIHAISFDHGVTGYSAPLANLESIRAHVRGG